MKVHKLNESYSAIEAESYILKQIFDFLTITTYDMRVMFGRTQRIARQNHFGSIQNNMILVQNGILQMLSQFGVKEEEEVPEYSEEFVDEVLEDIIKDLPFEPYDYQLKAAKESIVNKKQLNKMCTSSGKSMTISLVVEFFRRQNKKGLLLVPNINLLTQFKGDIKEYNLMDLYSDTHLIGGGNSDKHLDNSFTISTWQSMQNYKEDLHKLDYVIVDEAHRFASDVTSEIVKETINCKYKYGFTGTIPEDPLQKMELFGLFGLPKTYMTSRELIERGLGTPIKVNAIIMNYDKNDKSLFNNSKGWHKQLKFIKEHEQRNSLVVKLTCSLKGNSLLLFQHTEHGKDLFLSIMKGKYPDVEVKNKDITGKKSFEFQEHYGVYFLNGEDDAKTRERTRKIIEEHDDAILVANFALLSTGVSIKKLHNLVIGSPLKAYTTITQSIGRLMRLHPSKTIGNVYDFVDNFGYRKPGGIFYKQYIQRRNSSYNPEEFPIYEKEVNLQ